MFKFNINKTNYITIIYNNLSKFWGFFYQQIV